MTTQKESHEQFIKNLRRFIVSNDDFEELEFRETKNSLKFHIKQDRIDEESPYWIEFTKLDDEGNCPYVYLKAVDDVAKSFFRCDI